MFLRSARCFSSRGESYAPEVYGCRGGFSGSWVKGLPHIVSVVNQLPAKSTAGFRAGQLFSRIPPRADLMAVVLPHPVRSGPALEESAGVAIGYAGGWL